MVIANAQATLSACVAAIIKYHIDVLKSSLVFDYHGNNWEDDKPFFEVCPTLLYAIINFKGSFFTFSLLLDNVRFSSRIVHL